MLSDSRSSILSEKVTVLQTAKARRKEFSWASVYPGNKLTIIALDFIITATLNDFVSN
jgi:hypothetical protein